jgi:hypothetical protein
MKMLAIWAGVGAMGFMFIGMQVGLFQPRQKADKSAQEDEARPDAAPAKPVAKFPQDLAPCAQAKPVPAAAEYQFGPEPHPVVFLRLDGSLHPWQEHVRDQWQAETVAQTELAVIVGTPRRTQVSYHTYPNGAPPITRWQFELEISVIEAKTGKILANRLFRNVPRPLMRIESWETTTIGRTVSLQQVFRWVSRTSQGGFPEAHDPNPIVTQMD